jgi:hypothetical protein
MKASELYALAIEEYKQICILCTMTLRDYCKERHICYGRHSELDEQAFDQSSRSQASSCIT